MKKFAIGTKSIEEPNPPTVPSISATKAQIINNIKLASFNTAIIVYKTRLNPYFCDAMEEEIIKLELGKIHALKLIDFENEIKKGALVLDMRNALSFENGFIPRSIYFAFHEKTLKIANQLFELDRRIIIVAETGKETEASEGLLKLGYSNIGGYLEHGFSTWKEAGKQIDMIISITAEEFALDLQWSENSKTIDVRTPEEWTSGVVAGTILLPLENLPEKISNLDIKQEYEIYCQDGIRSLIATSFLKMHGFQLTKNLYGGILGLDEEISLVMP